MNDRERFVDTGYWLALINPSDSFYAQAAALAAQISGPLVTTAAVVLEVGDALSRSRWRQTNTSSRRGSGRCYCPEPTAGQRAPAR